MDTLIPDYGVELPVINQNLACYKTRYTYLSICQQTLPSTLHGQDSMLFEGLIKYDLEE